MESSSSSDWAGEVVAYGLVAPSVTRARFGSGSIVVVEWNVCARGIPLIFVIYSSFFLGNTVKGPEKILVKGKNISHQNTCAMKRSASDAQQGSLEATISIDANGEAVVAWAMARFTGSTPSAQCGPVPLKKQRRRRLVRPDDDDAPETEQASVEALLPAEQQEQALVEALLPAEQQDWGTVVAWLDKHGPEVFASASWSPKLGRATSAPSQVLPRPRTLLAVRTDPAPRSLGISAT